MKNIFLEKLFTKCGGETITRPFSKIENISESIAKSYMQFVYIVCQVESCQNILKLSYRPLAFTSYKSPYLILFYFINWPDFIVWLPLIRGMLDNICVLIVCQPGCDVISFEINLIFLIRLFFYMTKKSKQNVINYVINESFIEQLAEKHVTLFKFGSETNIYELKQAVKQWLKHAC